MKTLKRNLYITIGLIVGVEMGWFTSINYTIHLINNKREVVPIAEYTRLHDLELQLEKEKFLW